LARGSVLVIDDEPDFRELLAYELSSQGYEVTQADDGAHALELARRRRFHVAITDLMMPGMSGIETVARLKGADPSIEVIVATGYATVETAIACLREGACDYIQKPYEIAELKLLLERAFHKRGDAAAAPATGTPGEDALVDPAAQALNERAELVYRLCAQARRRFRAGAVGLVMTRPSGAACFSFEGDSALLKTVKDPAMTLAAGDGRRDAGHLIGWKLSIEGARGGVLVLARDDAQPPFTAAELHSAEVYLAPLRLWLDEAALMNRWDETCLAVESRWSAHQAEVASSPEPLRPLAQALSQASRTPGNAPVPLVLVALRSPGDGRPPVEVNGQLERALAVKLRRGVDAWCEVGPGAFAALLFGVTADRAEKIVGRFDPSVEVRVRALPGGPLDDDAALRALKQALAVGV
jgi:DNA-binding response OmpR family regulator